LFLLTILSRHYGDDEPKDDDPAEDDFGGDQCVCLCGLCSAAPTAVKELKNQEAALVETIIIMAPVSTYYNGG
jgi:hypothetical protein